MKDMKTTAFEEKFITYISQEEEAGQAIQGHMEKHQCQSGGRSEVKAWLRAFIVVSSGLNEQERVEKFKQVMD